MSEEQVRFDRFRAEVAALAAVQLGAPVGIAGALWSEQEYSIASVQYNGEALTFHRSVLWRGHRVHLAWAEDARVVFFYVDRDNPGGPRPPRFLDESGQPVQVRISTQDSGG